ncbi:MAG: hypothetical protein R3240_00215 [Gammaproteobacteria bacterium]|nr:hypothetical protein [Gammaproteobacteria bacterium]
MPYFVYKYENTDLGKLKEMKLLSAFEAFREASKFAKSQRADQTADDVEIIKVIFANNQLEAETLLREKREPQLRTGED